MKLTDALGSLESQLVSRSEALRDLSPQLTDELAQLATAREAVRRVRQAIVRMTTPPEAQPAFRFPVNDRRGGTRRRAAVPVVTEPQER